LRRELRGDLPAHGRSDLEWTAGQVLRRSGRPSHAPADILSGCFAVLDRSDRCQAARGQELTSANVQFRVT